jgi:hypothetical protein
MSASQAGAIHMGAYEARRRHAAVHGVSNTAQCAIDLASTRDDDFGGGSSQQLPPASRPGGRGGGRGARARQKAKTAVHLLSELFSPITSPLQLSNHPSSPILPSIHHIAHLRPVCILPHHIHISTMLSSRLSRSVSQLLHSLLSCAHMY